MSEVEKMISIALGPRSDASEQFGRTSPRSMFDIERDAEIQDISRTFEVLKASTEEYLALHQRKFFWLMRGLLATLLLLLVNIGGLIWQFRPSAPQAPVVPALASVPSKSIDPVPAVALASPTLPVSSNAVVPFPAVVMASPARVAVATAAAPLAPASQAATSASKSLSKAATTVIALPATTKVDRSKTVTPDPVSEGIPRKSVSSVQSPLDVAASVKPAVDAKLSKTDSKKNQNSADEKLFVLEAAQAPSSINSTKPIATPESTPKMPTVEPPARSVVRDVSKASRDSVSATGVTTPASTRKPDASEAGAVAAGVAKPNKATINHLVGGESAKTPIGDLSVRREKYGAKGVITMTPAGVVIFDRERRAQRLIPLGGQLPDGSILKSIDAKGNRISTDGGDVVFD